MTTHLAANITVHITVANKIADEFCTVTIELCPPPCFARQHGHRRVGLGPVHRRVGRPRATRCGLRALGAHQLIVERDGNNTHGNKKGTQSEHLGNMEVTISMNIFS